MDQDEIITGLSAGDNSAYGELYKQHYHVLCKFACVFVQDRFVAATIVNDVIFAIWQNRDKLRIQALRGYLIRAVRNRCLNYLEQQQRLAELQQIEQTVVTPLQHLLEKELDKRVQQSIANMSELTAACFKLSRFTGLKYHEIAERLGVSVDVVKYHMKQALARLRNDLEGYL